VRLRRRPTREACRAGVGQPGWFLLNQWGASISRAFDATPYLVGSAARGKKWRDVDVRLMLSDMEFERIFGPFQRPMHTNALWSVICGSIAMQGREVTGLPIDFQIQTMREGNADPNAGCRVPLGIYV
jgi:hypothetical protein